MSHTLTRHTPGLAFWVRATVIFCLALIVLPAYPKFRKVISAPLVLHDPHARGEACYVLAGGGAIWERLDAAADLIQMKRVSRIIIMRDDQRSQFSYKTNSSWSRAQWISDYLAWRGIPADRISWIASKEGELGTLTEARAVASTVTKEVRRLVVVTSAPHMRRSILAFKRSLPKDVQVIPYAATDFGSSYEMFHPIWTEYLKLLVYAVVA